MNGGCTLNTPVTVPSWFGPSDVAESFNFADPTWDRFRASAQFWLVKNCCSRGPFANRSITKVQDYTGCNAWTSLLCTHRNTGWVWNEELGFWHHG